MDPNWSTRRTFERFLYDYLIKRNMHQTAEVFRYESNLQLDPCASSSDAMNVPKGFLEEWWSLNYDFDSFRAWLQVQDTHGLEAAQGCNASQEAGCSMNVEAMTQLPNNFTPVETFSIGGNSIPSHVMGELPLFSLLYSQQELSGQLSQFFSPFSHQAISGELSQLLLPFSQGELLTSTRADNVTSACIEVEPSIQNTSKPQYTGFSEETDPVLENLINTFWLFDQDQPSLFNDSTAGEINRNMENLLAHGEGNNDRNELVGSQPTLRDGDKTSKASDFSSNF
ncbi:hypothetical protein GLYMA_08G334401v4 [Glycine max]|nr:hypothetical protein GLYMA_08G334401v4 [Glycine max]KAH1054348.1 hypothetical protein GYH30_023223 [Glycine max]|eukprot:XP_025985594.1 uncharacterized protein LOC113002412 [Glycine max]